MEWNGMEWTQCIGQMLELSRVDFLTQSFPLSTVFALLFKFPLYYVLYIERPTKRVLHIASRTAVDN
jgi:hypothetical protein